MQTEAAAESPVALAPPRAAAAEAVGAGSVLASLRTRIERGIREFGLFGVLHAFTTISAIGYSIVQTLVFAHTLPPETYARLVATTVIAFYMAPISQAIGRATFVMMRARRGETPPPEVTAVLYGNFAVMMAVSLSVPLFIQVHSWTEYVNFSLWLWFCLLTNIWAFDVQSTLWAVGVTKLYEVYSAPRRFLMFVSLYYLWRTHDFFGFACSSVLISLVTSALMTHHVRHITAAFAVRRVLEVSPKAFRSELHVVVSSLASTFSELVILNGPYAILGWVFGVGPAMICYDTIMKCVRVSLSACRIFAEIVLPKQTEAQQKGDFARSRRLLLAATLGSFGANGVLALLMLTEGPVVFHALLGKNNVLPPGMAPVAAALVMLAVVYQPSALMISYNGITKVIWRISAASVLGMAAFFAFLVLAKPDLVVTMWAFVAFFAAITLFISFSAGTHLGRRVEPAGT